MFLWNRDWGINHDVLRDTSCWSPAFKVAAACRVVEPLRARGERGGESSPGMKAGSAILSIYVWLIGVGRVGAVGWWGKERVEIDLSRLYTTDSIQF